MSPLTYQKERHVNGNEAGYTISGKEQNRKRKKNNNSCNDLIKISTTSTTIKNSHPSKKKTPKETCFPWLFPSSSLLS